jgi:hypothetical protein
MPKQLRTCSRGHSFHEEPCPQCWPGYRTYEARAKVWLYPGDSANWHFVTLPTETSLRIRERFSAESRGWGSLPVHVTIGQTSWKTSLFPDKKADAYLLPLKADVRRREDLHVGQEISLTVEILA